MSDQKLKPEDNDGGPLLQDLRAVLKKHNLKINVLPGMVREVITDIVQYVGRVVRAHEALEARVVALENKKSS